MIFSLSPAEDGQNIFVNSLNARCLIEEYGSLENSPKKIVGQILDFESFTMNKVIVLVYFPLKALFNQANWLRKYVS